MELFLIFICIFYYLIAAFVSIPLMGHYDDDVFEDIFLASLCFIFGFIITPIMLIVLFFDFFISKYLNFIENIKHEMKQKK